MMQTLNSILDVTIITYVCIQTLVVMATWKRYTTTDAKSSALFLFVSHTLKHYYILLWIKVVLVGIMFSSQ